MKLSQRALYNPREHLRMLIRHKLGYRVYFPGTYEWEKIAIIIAAGHEIKAPQAFAYICADLFTAQAIMAEASDDQEKAIYIKAVLKDSYQADPQPLWLIKALAFHGLRKGSLTKADAKRLGVPECYYRVAYEVVEILNSSIPVVNKLDRLAEVLKPILDECFRQQSDLSRLPEIFAFDEFESDKALVALASLPSDLLNVAMTGLYGKGSEDAIEFAPDPVVVQAARLMLYNEFLASRRSRSGQVESGRYYGTWTIGDDPAQLLIRDTLRAFGIVAPPIFSLKWADGEKGPSSSCSHLGIVLDVSYSMLSPPSKAARAKEAAYGLVEEAARKGVQVSVCFFNSATLFKSYGYKYDEARTDIASVIVKGGTDLIEPLRRLHQSKVDSVVVITDAEVNDPADRETVISLMTEISQFASLNIFMIAEDRHPWIEGRMWKTFWIKPGERFTEKTVIIL